MTLFKCPDCGEKFRHDMAAGWPEVCAICDAYVGLKGKPEIALPAFLSPKAKTADNLYREMQRGAEHRMDVAAAMTGQDRSAFADMRVSNMQTAVHHGAVAAPPPPGNDATGRMDQVRQAGQPAGHV